MWRAFFLAVGISLVIIGGQCLIVERVVLARGTSAEVENGSYLFGGQSATQNSAGKDITPPDWAPWSLMAAGAVVMIYSFTVPKRVSG